MGTVAGCLLNRGAGKREEKERGEPFVSRFFGGESGREGRNTKSTKRPQRGTKREARDGQAVADWHPLRRGRRSPRRGVGASTNGICHALASAKRLCPPWGVWQSGGLGMST